MPRPVPARLYALACLAVLPAWTAPAQPAPPPEGVFYQARPAMGTTAEVYLVAPDAAQADVWFTLVFDEIERLEATISTYRASSEFSRLNAHAGEAPVTTDPEVFALLERVLAYSARTDGAFDPTVGRLVEAWGFFRDAGRYPSAEALAAARAETGWQHVRLDPPSRTVHVLAPGLELDPGAFGKGYALDRAAALLRAAGAERALLGIGQSSYLALGAPPGAPGWAIHIRDPLDAARRLSTVYLRDEALSTSGSYEKFFELGGRVYCHILDPRTGHPVRGRLQVTVRTPHAFDADVLSTAFFVMGPGEAARSLLSEAGAALFVLDGGEDRLARWRWPEAVSDATPAPGSDAP